MAGRGARRSAVVHVRPDDRAALGVAGAARFDLVLQRQGVGRSGL